jgi:hypothetical protein
VSGFALFQMPGREADCSAVLRQSLAGKQELGDVIGMAYSISVLGWLAVKTGAPLRAAWLLGVADVLWDRGGGVRFSGTVIMEQMHQQAAAAALAEVGRQRYDEEVAAGAGYVQGQIDAGAGTGALRLEIP